MTDFAPLLNTFLFVLLLIVAIGWGIVTPWWVFGPLKRAQLEQVRSPQWTLGDLFSFVALAAFPTALVSYHARTEDWPVSVIACSSICSTVFAGLLWFAGVQELSRAGIRTIWRRVVFMTLLLPTATISMVALAVSVLAVLVRFRQALRNSSDSELSTALATAITSFVLAGLSGIATRYLVRGESALQDGRRVRSIHDVQPTSSDSTDHES